MTDDPVLDPRTSLGPVRLAAADLAGARAFYESTVGLRALAEAGESVTLGVDGEAIVELAGEPGAPPRPPGTTGLFHLAILVPTRVELAHALRRVAQSGWRLTGASDHLVSEALYLSDPEGNGIEIYRDRPREEWERVGGELRMATLPLDLEGVLGELRPGDEPPAGMPAGTRMGHVHLQVADIAAVEAFYAGVLGFEVTVRSYPGALFLSTGGYHHHLGVNVWASEGASPPPAQARGLRRFEVRLADEDELSRVTHRLAEAGVAFESRPGGLLVADPAGNHLALVV